MKKLILLLLLCGTVYGQGAPPTAPAGFGYDAADFVYNKKGDSVLLVPCSLWVTPIGIYFDDGTVVLDSALLDSIDNALGRFSGAGLSYWTESDAGDTSVFTATSPNTWVGFNDNLTMKLHGIYELTNVHSASGSNLSLAANAAAIRLNYNMATTSTVEIYTGLVKRWSFHRDTLISSGAGVIRGLKEPVNDDWPATKKYQDDTITVVRAEMDDTAKVYNMKADTGLAWFGPVVPHIRAGDNITLTAAGDTIIVTGAAGGSGTTDSTYINDGTQYGPYTNDMYKIKEGTGINIVREDSTTYDVFNFNATLGTTIEYGEITATTSANWASLVSDETGSGLWVFGTSPTFTTDITSPLVIGGTATTSDLSLKTTSGVGETGADMHFLVGNNGATEAMTILNNGDIGIKTTNPDEDLHITDNNAALKLEDDSGNDAKISIGNSQLCIGSDPDNLVASSDICFDIDGAEVARFHSSTNFGIGTLSPPERLSVVGNIAIGDTATGVVDVYNYIGTDGSWTNEYFPKWADALGRFEISDDLDVTGTIKSDDTLFYTFILADPDALYATDTQWGFDPKTRLAVTIRSIYVSLDADPTTEMTFSVVFCDAGVGWVSPTTIDDTATVAGVTDVTGGFGDATVPAGKKLYFLFDADPDDAITQATVKIGYTVD